MPVTVPQSTLEKPLTAIDYIVPLEQCNTVIAVGVYSAALPEAIRSDERFTRAVAKRLSAIKDKSNQRRESA